MRARKIIESMCMLHDIQCRSCVGQMTATPHTHLLMQWIRKEKRKIKVLFVVNFWRIFINCVWKEMGWNRCQRRRTKKFLPTIGVAEMMTVETKWNHNFIPKVRLWIYSAFSCFMNECKSIDLSLQTIPCIDVSSRSSYMADTNNHGIAAMTHSNRCISLIDTGIMKRIGEINGLQRTVWTLCFHPYDLNLLATGNLGGTVCVFRKTVSDGFFVVDSSATLLRTNFSLPPPVTYSISEHWKWSHHIN